MSLFTKHKSLILTSLGVFFVAGIILQISSTVTAIFETQARIGEQKGRLATLQGKEDVLQNTASTGLATQARRLTNVVPETINLSLIVATLQKAAAQTGVVLGEFSIASDAQVISILPITENEKLTSFQFKVSLVGGFNNIEAFIERLTFVSPILRVEKVEFAQDKSTLVLNFYFQPKKTFGISENLPLRKLSDRHTQAMTEVFKLEPPVLEEGTTPATSSGDREDPFR